MFEHSPSGECRNGRLCKINCKDWVITHGLVITDELDGSSYLVEWWLKAILMAIPPIVYIS